MKFLYIEQEISKTSTLFGSGSSGLGDYEKTVVSSPISKSHPELMKKSADYFFSISETGYRQSQWSGPPVMAAARTPVMNPPSTPPNLKENPNPTAQPIVLTSTHQPAQRTRLRRISH